MPRSKINPTFVDADDRPDDTTAEAAAPQAEAEGAAEAAPAQAPQAPRPPSPLDAALRGTRPRPAAQVDSLWLAASEQLTTPPMAFDPLNITAHEGYGEEHAATLEPAVTALAALRKATQAAIDVRNAMQADVTLTEAAAVVQASEATSKIMTPRMQQVEAALRNVQAQANSITAALSAPLTSGGNSTQAAEVRAVFRSLPQAERMSAMQAAIAGGDAVVVTSILGASTPMLTGLTAPMVHSMTQAWHRRQQPQQVARLELLNHTAAVLAKAGQTYATIGESLQGARGATVNRINLQTGKVKAVIGSLLPA